MFKMNNLSQWQSVLEKEVAPSAGVQAPKTLQWDKIDGLEDHFLAEIAKVGDGRMAKLMGEGGKLGGQHKKDMIEYWSTLHDTMTKSWPQLNLSLTNLKDKVKK